MKKMIFLNVGWMKNYSGITRTDRLIGGGSYPKMKGYGDEIFNFQAHAGHFFGACGKKVKIERLGASPKDRFIGNVLIVWIAKAKSGGVFLIGWYKNATIYREWQSASNSVERRYKGRIFNYFVKARTIDSKLLPEDERILRIPTGKGGKGEYHVWYADKPNHLKFKQEVMDFILHGKKPKIISGIKRNPYRSIQLDPLKRQRIEKAAINSVIKYYEGNRYEVRSVEGDNIGWDLEARQENRLLRLEVKGLSYSEISVEVTPNEYSQMKKHRDTYRLCIVSDALSKHPKLSTFSFSPESGQWEDNNRNHLRIKEIKSARLFL